MKKAWLVVIACIALLTDINLPHRRFSVRGQRGRSVAAPSPGTVGTRELPSIQPTHIEIPLQSWAAFFAALHPGLLVKFQGELVGGSVVWDEAEIENGDG